jgi:hypothetical protein
MSTAVERSLQNEPLLWKAHAAKGWYLLSRRDFVGADAAMREASRLKRSQESIPGPELINYLHQVGRWTDRLEETAHSESVDTALSTNHETLYILDRKEEARSAFAKLKGISPGNDRYYLSMLAMDQASPEEADLILEGFSKKSFGRSWFEPSTHVLATLRQRLARGNPYRATFVRNALVAAHHGDVELALDFLRAEFRDDGFGAYHLLWHPQLKRVRASAGFKTFLIDLGLPEMWRKSGSWGDFCEPAGGVRFSVSLTGCMHSVGAAGLSAWISRATRGLVRNTGWLSSGIGRVIY